MYTYSALDYTSLLDPGPLSIQSPDGPDETPPMEESIS